MAWGQRGRGRVFFFGERAGNALTPLASFFLCTSLTFPSFLPLFLLPPSDHAAAGGPDGGGAGDLPEPHGCHRCRPDAANGRLQRQRAGGCPPHPFFRYSPWLHPSTHLPGGLGRGGTPALTPSLLPVGPQVRALPPASARRPCPASPRRSG